jgi:PAS domain S-box-containing protein
MQVDIEKILYFITHKKWTESIEDFFPSLVTFLGETLGFDYTLVGELLAGGETVKTVGFYADGDILPNIEYSLVGTPCENIVGQSLCNYPRGIQEIFPEHSLLMEMKAQSYVGIPLWDTQGDPIGLIALIGKSEFTGDARMVEMALEIAAVRCAHELEHMRADQELRESERRFRDIAKTMPSWIWEVDTNGVYTYASPKVKSVLGYEPQEIVGKTPFDLMPLEEAQKIQAAFQTIATTKQPIHDLENWNLTKDGDRACMMTNGIPLLDDKGNLLGYRGVDQNITGRKKAEKSQAYLRRRLSSFWNIATKVDATLQELCDDVLVELLNMTECRYSFYGFMDEAEEVMTLHSWSTGALADCAVINQPIHYPITKAGIWGAAVRERKPLVVNEYTMDHPQSIGLPEGHVMLENLLSYPVFRGGKIVAVAAMANKKDGPFTDEDVQQVGSFLNSVQTLLEKRRAERELAWELKVNKVLADLGNILINPGQPIEAVATQVLSHAKALTGSEHGYVSEIDPVTGNNIGHANTAMLGDECKIILPEKPIVLSPGDDGLYAGLWGHAFNTKEPFYTNHPAGHPQSAGYPEGHVPLERFLSVPVLFGGEVVGQIALANPSDDYTDKHRDAVVRLGGLYALAIHRYREEHSRLHLERQLAQAHKVESVGRLAGGVAHDFNNMLSIILGNVEMVMEDVGSENPVMANLQQIYNAAQRSADLTRQLLAFARKQTIAPKVLDLNKTIQGMIKMLERLIGENIDLSWIPGEQVWPVKMDPGQIDQVLVNLCVNARDAIADVGKVTIETGTAVFDERYCADHAGFLPGEYVLMAMSDNGCGIDTDILANVFEPFFTTKETGKGTGLGLATVYGVVKQNKGFVNVYSEPGQGSTFKIYLPRYLTKAAYEPEKLFDRPDEHGHETILLVEDESAILEMTTRMLERLGYNVIGAVTPAEAIHLAQKYTGEIHLLLTDVVMPEMNGRDLAKNILTFYPNLKRLFMSGYTANVIAHHGVLDKGVNFIEKPFSRESLGAIVREVLDGGEF